MARRKAARKDSKPKEQPKARVRKAVPPGKLLLAKLLGVFIGALLGFVASYIISENFIVPFQKLTTDAEEAVQSAERELETLEPALNKARRELAPLEQQWLELQKNRGIDVQELQTVISDVTDAEDAAELAGDGEPAEPEQPVQLTREFDEEAYQLARIEFRKLSNKRQRLTSQVQYWNDEAEAYRKNIEFLNLLGIAVVVVFCLLGYLLYPMTLRLLDRLSRSMEDLTGSFDQRTSQATIGFFAGILAAIVIILAVFNTFSEGILSLQWFRLIFGTFIVILLGLAGSLVGITYFSPQSRKQDPYKEYRRPAAVKVLDTSVIIDGRVREVSQAGFLDGTLLVTNSVLRELQNMADSSNDRQRAKGRRGLELLRTMQDDNRIDLEVFDDSEFEQQAHSTDEQLIIVAQDIGGLVVTNDYNLNRVAAIRDVRVVNINALANAVKTNLLPGDIIELAIVDRGSQRGQGKGYLEDGTMVVVEDGEPFINKVKEIKITSVTQTVQGRMLFGRVDAVEGRNGGN